MLKKVLSGATLLFLCTTATIAQTPIQTSIKGEVIKVCRNKKRFSNNYNTRLLVKDDITLKIVEIRIEKPTRFIEASWTECGEEVNIGFDKKGEVIYFNNLMIDIVSLKEATL